MNARWNWSRPKGGGRITYQEEINGGGVEKFRKNQDQAGKEKDWKVG